MSNPTGIRFEVIRNGNRVCVSGIENEGVLSFGITYVKHANSDPQYDLHVSGLGHFHPTLRESQHVTWSSDEHVGIGDEITIRLLPAGAFDPPMGLTPHTSRSIDDRLFGRLDYNIDAWNGTAPFESPPFESARVHLVGSDAGPSKSQKKWFRDFKKRHSALWPAIAQSLVRCHSQIESYDELVERIHPQFSINMYDDSNSAELVYSMEGDPEGRAYFVKICNWEIAEVCSAD